MDTETEKKDEIGVTEKKEEDSGTKVTSSLQNQAIIEKLREIDTRQRETDRKLEEQKAAADKAGAPTLDEKNKLFWNNPAQELEKLIQKTVQPLIEFRDEFKAGTDYDRIKGEFKNDPRFKDFLAKPGVESQLDKLMEKNDKTRDAYLGSVLGLRGGIELGLVPKPEGYDKKEEKKEEDGDKNKSEKPSDTNKDGKVRTDIPPHLRPSSAPSPSGDNKETPLRELSETEERLRLENKLTKREYIELTDEVAPADVVGWKSEAERSKKEEK